MLFDGAFSQSEACLDVTAELNANQACQQAYILITSDNETNVTLSQSDLEAFCTQDCRDIVTKIAMECVS